MARSKIAENQVLDIDFLSEEEALTLSGALQNQINNKPDTFLELEDTQITYNGSVGKYLRVKSDESGLEFADVTSDEEKFVWRIKLAKFRPALLNKANSTFTPSGYDVYPIVADDWRTGSSSEHSFGDGYPQTVVIKSGTLIDFQTGCEGWMFYVKSTDVHSITDSIQNDDPRKEYFKRLKYIQNNDYKYISAWMPKNGWSTQDITPGTYGSLLIGYSFNNIRIFNIYNAAVSKCLYHGHLQTDGYLTGGFTRHENEFFVPFDETLKFDVQAGSFPAGGGNYVVKYIDVPSWW